MNGKQTEKCNLNKLSAAKFLNHRRMCLNILPSYLNYKYICSVQGYIEKISKKKHKAKEAPMIL